MLTPIELRERCIELGILDEDTDAPWNGQALETADGWYMQPSPKDFPDRIARMTKVDGQEVVDVYGSGGLLFRMGDEPPDDSGEWHRQTS